MNFFNVNYFLRFETFVEIAYEFLYVESLIEISKLLGNSYIFGLGIRRTILIGATLIFITSHELVFFFRRKYKVFGIR